MQNAALLTGREELELALQKYAEQFDFATVGYLSLDEAGAILRANLTTAALLGVERSRLLNRRLPLFVSPTCRPHFLAFLKNVLARTKNLVCEATMGKEGGGTFWAEIRATSVNFHQGDRQWYQIVVGDIARRKRASQLTPREMEVVQLIAEGSPSKLSASGLGISSRTVEKHRKNLMEKLNISNTADLTR